MRIACILENEFEDSELRIPVDGLVAAGHEVVLISREAGQEVKGKKKAEVVRADRGIDDVAPREFDALLIPGGKSPAKLKSDERFVTFVKRFAAEGKPIFAVCHGP